MFWRALRRISLQKVLAASALPILLLFVSLWQGRMARPDLNAYVLHFGRQIYAPGQKLANPEFDPRQLHRLLDRDPESPIYLTYPAETGEPTYLLVELGLTHGAPAGLHEPPERRRARSLTLYNGGCFRCPLSRFRTYARLKRIRLEILFREANNADQEYRFPPARPVYKKEFVLPDRPGPFRISLNELPLPEPSPAWPENMQVILAKIIILAIYPAQPGKPKQSEKQTLAIAELSYEDEPLPLTKGRP